MRVWLDAQLSPSLAGWMQATLHVEAIAVRDLGLRDAEDAAIFQQARIANAVVLTKDVDFVELLARLGPPPSVVWLTCGNTSNAALRELLAHVWPRVSTMLQAGEPLIEIAHAPT